MNKVNKILVIFLAGMSLFFWAIWELLQTQWFANIVAERLSKNITRELGVDLKFERLGFKLYPPASIIKQVKLNQVEKKKNGIQSVEANEVGLYFNILDFFSNKITVDKVRIHDAELVIDNVGEIDRKRSRKKISVEEIMASLLNYREARSWIDKNLPVKIDEILLENTFLIVEDKEFEINRLGLELFEDKIGLKGLFEDINLESKFLRDIKTGKYTSCELDLFLDEEKINANLISIKDGMSKIELKGNIKKKDSSFQIDLNTKLTGLTEDIFKLVKIDSITETKKGLLALEFSAKGDFKKPALTFGLTAEKLVLDWVNLDQVKVGGKIDKNKLIIESMNGYKETGRLKLINPMNLFDLDKGKFITQSADVRVEGLHSNYALHAINDFFHIFKGHMHGDVMITWGRDHLSFFPKKGFHIKDFMLKENSGKGNLLKNPGFKLMGGSLSLLNWEDFHMDTIIQMNNSTMSVKGKINSKGIDIITNNTTMNLEDVGPISGVPLVGDGSVDLRVKGPMDNVKFYFDVDVENFQVIGLQLGSLKGDVDLSLNTLRLGLTGVEANYLGNHYGGGGALEFGPKNSIDLNIRIFEGEYSNTLDMISPVLTNIRQYFPELSMHFNSELTIKGKLSGGELVVTGEMEAKDVGYKTENVDLLRVNYKISNKSVDLSNITMRKEQAGFKGKVSYDMLKDYLDFDGTLTSLNLSDLRIYRSLNLGLDGRLHGELSGRGKISDFSSRLQFKLLNSSVKNLSLGDSNLVLYNNGKDVFTSFKLFGDKISLDSMLSFGENKKRSKLKASIDTREIKTLMGVLSAHNILDEDLQGQVSAKVDSDFYIDNFDTLNLSATVNKLNLSRRDSSLRVVDGRNKIRIEKGSIKNLDIKAEGIGNVFELSGVGNIGNKFKIENQFKFDSSLIELVSDKIESTSGIVEGRALLVKEDNRLQNFFQLSGEKIDFSLTTVPGGFTDTNFKMVLDGNDLLIQRFQSSYGKGLVTVDGSIVLTPPFPKVNLEIDVDNSTIPIFEKSFVVLSGKGKVTGEKLPYFGYGNFSIYHGEILDSISDFKKRTGDSKQYNKYIPKTFKKNEYDFFNYDVSIDLARPIKIKNNLAELYFNGAIRTVGKDMSPQISGELNIVPNSSKFTFKGHAFSLTEGRITFPRQEAKLNPDIKFTGLSEINAYSVKVDIAGLSDNLNIGLSSDPALSQEDILSLLTIGVTTDVSKSLDETERQSVTTIGVGSLLMDQLKLNEGLTSSMGLQLSVLPEISEDETSLLRGKAAVTDSQATKLKSATKIQIKKKVSNDINISVSSTVGGTLEQKQEMNINYNINKKFSIEGIYEVNSSDENSNENPDSIGADLKYKWKF